MKRAIIKSAKFDTQDVYKIVHNRKGVHINKYKLKYYKNPGLVDSLIGTTAIKATDDGNGIEILVDGMLINLDYAQVELVRLMLNVIGDKEDATSKDIIL